MLMQVDPWHVWIILGIIFVIIEIFDPVFFFIALGIGAIGTGLLSFLSFVENNIPMQVVIFALLSFIAFLFTRKIGKKVLRNAGGETNVFALKGKVGFVTAAIPAEGKGRVKVGGEEWVAVAQNDEVIELDAKVTIIDVEGNKLIVSKS